MTIFFILIFLLSLTYYVVNIKKSSKTFKISAVLLAISFVFAMMISFGTEIKSPLVSVTERLYFLKGDE